MSLHKWHEMGNETNHMYLCCMGCGTHTFPFVEYFSLLQSLDPLLGSQILYHLLVMLYKDNTQIILGHLN